jgi:uncharacterized membrane protein
MILTALLLLADLEIASVTPTKDVLITDEPFHVTVVVKNHGAEAAKDVKVKVGVNALTFMDHLVAPKGWTCEEGPQFGYVLSCTTPSLAPEAEANVTIEMAAPQHSAMPYRIGATVQSSTEETTDAKNLLEKVLSIVSSPTNAELSLTATSEAKQVNITVKNAGPDDARDVMVVITEAQKLAFHASGDGWTCKDQKCTRPLLRAGKSATLKVETVAPPAGMKAVVSARVRADRIREAVSKDNGAKIAVP